MLYSLHAERGLRGAGVLRGFACLLFMLILFGTMSSIACAADEASQDNAGVAKSEATAEQKATEADQKAEEARKTAELKAKTEEAVKAKTEKEEELRQQRDEAAAQKQQEAAELAANDPLREIWASQRTMLDSVIKQSTTLSKRFLSDVSVLDQIRPVEQDINLLRL